MKRFLTLTMAAIMLATPACVTSVEAMDETNFAQLVQNVESATNIGATLLKPKLSAGARETTLVITAQIAKAISEQSVSLPTSLMGLVDQFAIQLVKAGVDEQEVALIKAAMLLADNIIGGIRLGVDGIGSERTQQIVLALVRGLELGLK